MNPNDLSITSNPSHIEGDEEKIMSPFRAFLKRHSLVIGLILMFLLTWPFMLANSGFLPFRIPFPASLFAGWGLSIAALIMTALTLGKTEVVALLKRFLLWRVGWKWYAVALFFFPFMQAVSVLVNALISGRPLDFSTVAAHQIFGPAAVLPIFILPFFITDLISNGEELGWRGYVLPRLQARYSALVASLVVGVIWALWHLPLWMAPGNTTPVGLFVIKVIAESVLYTWLYNNSRGSLLLVTFFHAASNTGGAFLPVATSISGANSDVLVIQIVLEILVAGLVVFTQGAARLSRTQPKQVQD